MDQAYSKIWPQIFVFYLEVWSAAARNLAHIVSSNTSSNSWLLAHAVKTQPLSPQ